MDYKKVYDSIIERARNRVEVTEAFDKHHIIPRSLGGSDQKTNLVRLTLREHFICHLLLAKIYGGGMLHAAMMLSSFSRYNSRCYKWLRERYIKEQMMGDNNPARRIPCTDQKREKCSETSRNRKWLNNGSESCMAKGDQIQQLLNEGWILGRLKTPSLIEGLKKGGRLTGGHNKGIPLSDELKKRLSDANKGKPSPTKGRIASDKERDVMRQRMLGKKASSETREKMSAAAKGKKHPWQTGANTRGRKWMTNGIENQMARPDDIKKLLDAGWVFGQVRNN